jgi:CxxC motif-containing protein (DUF1111 family)
VGEAILMHGGEASSAKETYESLPLDDRAALVHFVETL